MNLITVEDQHAALLCELAAARCCRGDRTRGDRSGARDTIVKERPMTTDQDTVMSVADAAAILKAGRSTIYELIRQGKIPAKKLGRARGIRIPVKAFYAWLDSPDNAQPSDEL